MSAMWHTNVARVTESAEVANREVAVSGGGSCTMGIVAWRGEWGMVFRRQFWLAALFSSPVGISRSSDMAAVFAVAAPDLVDVPADRPNVDIARTIPFVECHDIVAPLIDHGGPRGRTHARTSR